MDDLVSLLRSSSGVVDGDTARIWFIDQDGNNVRFWVSDEKLYRYRDVAEGNYSAGTAIASNVSGIALEYYDANDQPAAPSPEARKVAIELTVEREGHSARLQSAVWLRNR